MLDQKETELDLETILADEVQKIPGLTYIPNYLNIAEQNRLLKIVDQRVWSRELNRRMQQYGYTYYHQEGAIVSSSYIGDLPSWASCLAQQLARDFSTAIVPDQLLVNEYQPGQGCKSHIDCIPCFGETIFLLSLASSCVMEFTDSQTKKEIPILLLPGSLVILQKAARYLWRHGIADCKVDRYKGREFVRTRRVSLTFREVLFPHK